MRILGIETSCDETAAGVVEDGRLLNSNVISSQVELHSVYGGVVPEVASRQHVRDIVPVVEKAVADCGMALDEVDVVGNQSPSSAGHILCDWFPTTANLFFMGLV